MAEDGSAPAQRRIFPGHCKIASQARLLCLIRRRIPYKATNARPNNGAEPTQ